ncbi:MAG: hypothetical protein UT39_C0004G0046 [Candidatus Woesebacteria bacterium GW2011_GWA1_39_21]|uniref:Uncharacterized protein n=1 Tax=Candidatus Woesebacteria bacterium GW2011_GWA1_39_21 TaxID=1618550 RepID=A0A0G0RDF8_9BACT|nr:MAG: hypothetical protein UT39_C0004G0046 [Candidatus Woesebacteria bacterium GW2011_GWA1_39_21]
MRKQKTPALVNLAIYTTITVFLWIFFDVYRSLKKAPVLNIDSKILEPIDPNLDTNLLQEIESATFFDQSSPQISPPLNDENNAEVATESSEVNQ